MGQEFIPTSVYYVDGRGRHDIFGSLQDVEPIVIDDIGAEVVVLVGGDRLTLKPEADNPWQYTYKIKGRDHRDVINKAYRNVSTKEIEYYTVTTTNPQKGVEAMVIVFTKRPVGIRPAEEEGETVQPSSAGHPPIGAVNN